MDNFYYSSDKRQSKLEQSENEITQEIEDFDLIDLDML